MPEPILGFSEFISPTAEQDILYHVEWLTNEQCFPSLSSSSKKDTYPSNTSNTEWQLIDDNEIAQAQYALPGITITSTDSLLDEGGAEFWEFIQHSPQMGPSYAMLATAAQDPLVEPSPIYPFSSIHPYADSVIGKTESSNVIDKEDLAGDDFYHLYEARKSHGSHSYFGNKNYFERKQVIAYREFWDYWGCGKPEITPRYLHQCVAFQSHAKQYKPPGPRNANKNKKERNLKPQNRLEL